MSGRPTGLGKARAGGNRWPNKRLAWREWTAATDSNDDCERHSRTNSLQSESNLQWKKLQTVPRTRTPVNVDMQHPQRRPVPRAETTNTFKIMGGGAHNSTQTWCCSKHRPTPKLQKTQKNLVGIFSLSPGFCFWDAAVQESSPTWMKSTGPRC